MEASPEERRAWRRDIEARAREDRYNKSPVGIDPFQGTYHTAMWEDAMSRDDKREMYRQQHETVQVMANGCCTLDIEFEDREALQPIGNLINVAAAPEAKIRSLGWDLEMDDDDPDDEERIPNDKYLDHVILENCKFLCVNPYAAAYRDELRRVYSRRDRKWRVKDIMSVVLDVECYTRQHTDWFGGIDSHHIFCESVEITDGKVHYHFGS